MSSLLLIDATDDQVRLARMALPGRRWQINNFGVDDATPPAATARARYVMELVRRTRPDVVLACGLTAARALSVATLAADADFGGAPRMIWLTSRDVVLDLMAEPAIEELRGCFRVVEAVLVDDSLDATSLSSFGYEGPRFDVSVALAWEGRRMPMRPRSVGHRKVIVLDGRHGLMDRALVALAGLHSVADVLDGYRLRVLNPTKDVHLAARLLAGDTGMPVEIKKPRRFEDLVKAHRDARVSIRLSIDGGVNRVEVAAMLAGATPVLSGDSLLVSAVNRSITFVDANDPASLAIALRPIVASDDRPEDQSAAANREYALAARDPRPSASSFAAAVASLLGRP